MNSPRTFTIAAVSALTAVLALAQDPPPEAPPTVTGVVSGRIVFEGEIPPKKKLKIDSEQAKGCCPVGVAVDDTDLSLLIDEETRGLANVVVTLKVPGVEVPLPEKPLVLDQKGCRFEPHVLIVPAGAKVSILNSDAILHNIHTASFKNKSINLAIDAGGSTVVKLDKAEPIKVSCDYHPWMKCMLYVTDATHWALSGARGEFFVEGVPPGTYEVTLWHETLGRTKAQVTGAEDGSCAALEIKMKVKKKRRGQRK